MCDGLCCPCQITEIDAAKERFLVTLKPSDLKLNNSRLSQKEVVEESLVQFERLLAERDILLNDQGRLCYRLLWPLSNDQGIGCYDLSVMTRV